MKNIYILLFFYMGLSIIYFNKVDAQQMTESVTFSVRTSSPGGNFSPKNIGAIWIEDESGKFIKTIQLWANKRIQYLYTWNSISSANTVDAVTGATLSSHQAHLVSWNLKDYLGNIVPNGNYKIKIEITDQHSQGPLASFDFPVGAATDSLSIPDQNNFHDIILSWISVLTDVNDEETFPSNYNLFQNYPNPFNPSTLISYSIPKSSNVKLSVYDVLGNEVIELVNSYKSAGYYSTSFNASTLTSGIYFYSIVAGTYQETKKMLLIK